MTVGQALAEARDAFQGRNFTLAAEIARQVLRAVPGQPDALTLLGMVACVTGRPTEALPLFEQAHAASPGDASILANWGIALQQVGRLSDAIDAFNRAAALGPNVNGVWYNLGTALNLAGRPAPAADAFRRALALDPRHVPSQVGLADALKALGQWEAAAEGYGAALYLAPAHLAALNNLGNVLKLTGDLDGAAAAFEDVLRQAPSAPVWSNLGLTRLEQGRLGDALAAFDAALRLDPSSASAASNRLLARNYDPTASVGQLLEEHAWWGTQFAATASEPAAATPLGGRKLRLGYVSPDFRRHPLASFLEPLLSNHDRERFEVFAYAEVAQPDPVTERLQRLVAGWRSTWGHGDAQVAQLIRADGINILIDLAGHTAQSRLRVFAHQPAPVRLTYLGYPNTTGVPAMQYRLTDSVCDPPGEAPCHTEELVRLRGCFCCFAPPGDAPGVAPLPAQLSGRLTFGSPHNPAKLNDGVLDVWAAILRELPAARVLFVRHSLTGSARERVIGRLRGAGVPAAQIDFVAPGRAGPDYLEAYQHIDLVLDPWPWGGHATTCEALWMGVPVLTLRGGRHAGRMSASVLAAAGLGEWVAGSVEEYVARAQDWAGRIDELAELRRTLRDRVAGSPLCDAAGFTRQFEGVLEGLCWRAGGEQTSASSPVA
jgi:predicted O-linked N-acetylglucosamine transferase (SPINDLY family)